MRNWKAGGFKLAETAVGNSWIFLNTSVVSWDGGDKFYLIVSKALFVLHSGSSWAAGRTWGPLVSV